MSQPRDAKTGLLVIGHGTRDEAGVAEFLLLVDQLRQALPDVLVGHAFIELVAPGMEQGLALMVERGCERVAVLPLLLLAAGHAKRDIPQAIEAAELRYPAVRFGLCSHLGCHPKLLELSVARMREAVEGRSAVDPAETLLLMVGRGSSCAQANAEMYRLARLRWELAPVGGLEIAFTSLTEPSLARSLELVAKLPYRRIVVQPHLLFSGRIVTRIHDATRKMADAIGDNEWIAAPVLGPHRLLVEACLSRAELPNFAHARTSAS
ncbi:MAG: sirohydrochlorin chelatase [Pirellulales bacterium]|nr:sirohydrochlorin chelatase [Pirellulales bacterium]